MNGFLGAKSGDSGQVVIFGVPYAHGSPHLGGAVTAPSVLRGLTKGESLEEGVFDYSTGNQILGRLSISDLGDIRYRAAMSRRKYFEELTGLAERLSRSGAIPVALGGDHSITLPLATGVCNASKRMQVVILDAHHDDSLLEPEASPTHANFVRFLSRNPAIARIVQLGVRGFSSLAPSPPQKVLRCDLEALQAHLEPRLAVYLSIDTDAFDPRIAPAVAHPQPGGLAWEDLTRVLATFERLGCTISGIDWTEYDPNLDTQNYITGVGIVHSLIQLLSYLEKPKTATPVTDTQAVFPFDLFDSEILDRLGGELGTVIHELKPVSLVPPFPWGQWLVACLSKERLEHVQGDFMECGVARGGMSLLLGHLAAARGRKMYALDSFDGLPNPDPLHDNPYFKKGDYSAREDRGRLFGRFQTLVRRYRLEGVVTTIEGYIENTLTDLAKLPQILSVVHLDLDLHHSMETALAWAWPRLSDGGILAIDDFFHHSQGAARATTQFFARLGMRPLFHVSFPYGVVIIKGESIAGMHRSIDGEVYTLDFLRSDGLLRTAITDSTRRHNASGRSRAALNASLLDRLLQPDQVHRSSDLYDYLRAMEDFWDDMDVSDPAGRPEILI